MRIQGGVFLVTGGASGLGAGTARLLAAQGAQVVLADMKAAEGTALAASLGSQVRFVETNVANEESARAAIDAAIAAFGRLDGLINCAGIVHGEKVVGKDGLHSLDAFRRVIDVNLVGTFNMIRLAAGAMINNPRKSVV